MLGNSGATIITGRDIVMKCDDESKLKKQIARQTAFHFPGLETPTIYATGSTGGGRYTVAMERIYPAGKLWVTAVDMVLRFVEWQYETGFKQTIGDALLSKASEAYHGARVRAIYLGLDCEGRLTKLLDYVDATIHPSTVLTVHPQSHGDLTLCNILPSPRGIYLIDFHPGPVAGGPLLDLVKLRQDTAHGWVNALEPMSIEKDMLDGLDTMVVDVMVNKDPVNARLYPALQVLNLMRVMPYVPTERLFTHLLLEAERCTQ